MGVCMPAKKYHVNLTDSERQYLLDLIKKGKTSARRITRARILLLADEGQSDKEIAAHLLTSTPTVCRVRKRYCKEGVEAAIKEKSRPGAPPKLNGRVEAMLTVLTLPAQLHRKGVPVGPCACLPINSSNLTSSRVFLT